MKRSIISILALASSALATGLTSLPALANQENEGNMHIVCKDGSIQYYNSDLGPNLTGPEREANAARLQGAINRCGPNGYSDPSDPMITNGGVKGRPVLHATEAVMVEGVKNNAVMDSATEQAATDQGRPVDPVKPDHVTLNCSKIPGRPNVLNLSTNHPAWKLTMPSGSASAIVPANNVAWSAVPGAAWVGPAGAPATVGDYNYTAKFHIAGCPNKTKVSVAVQYRSDNIGTLLIDGVVVKNQAGTPNYGFLPGSLTTHTHNFPMGTTGLHTITLRVRNSGGPTGMAMQTNVIRN